MKKSISGLWLRFMSFILLACCTVVAFAHNAGVNIVSWNF